MEPTVQWVIVAVIILGILIRGEIRSNGNYKDIEHIYDRLDKHSSDTSIHHPDDELNRRFKMLEDGIGRIEKGMEKLDSRLDVFFHNK